MRGFVCMNNKGTITLSSAIAKGLTTPEIHPLATGAKSVINTFESGMSVCIFEVALNVPEESKDLLFDLTKPLHLLIASGDVNGGVISYHGPRGRFVTREKIDITKGLVCFSYGLTRLTSRANLQSWAKIVARIGNYSTNDIPPSPILYVFKVKFKSNTCYSILI